MTANSDDLKKYKDYSTNIFRFKSLLSKKVSFSKISDFYDP